MKIAKVIVLLKKGTDVIQVIIAQLVCSQFLTKYLTNYYAIDISFLEKQFLSIWI